MLVYVEVRKWNCTIQYFFIELEHALDSKTGDFEHASQMLFGVILAIILLQLTRKVFLKQIIHIIDADR